MNSHIKRMQKAAAVAAQYRSENPDLPQEGFVILWRMKATGWTLILDRPHSFRPGVLAVGIGGCDVFQATGGDYQNGAAEFSRIYDIAPVAPPRYYVEPSYACNDLARARKGSQDIVGYDVRDRVTGIVEIPCETEEEAEAEAALLNKEGGAL